MLTYYLGGHMTDKNSLYIFSQSIEHQEEAHTFITFQKIGKNSSPIKILNWTAVGWVTFQEKLFIVGENGESVFVDQGKILNKNSIANNLILTGVNYYRDNLVVYGMSNVVKYSSDGIKWRDGNKGIRADNYGILSLCHNPPDKTYLSCWDGEIYSGEINKWKDVSSPTNDILTSCLVLEDGTFLACGKDGTIIQGKGEQNSAIDHDFKYLEFFDIFEYYGEIYIASTTTIFRLKLIEKSLSPVLGWYLPDNGVYSSHMKTTKGFWIFTEKTIYEYFDGNFNELES